MPYRGSIEALQLSQIRNQGRKLTARTGERPTTRGVKHLVSGEHERVAPLPHLCHNFGAFAVFVNPDEWQVDTIRQHGPGGKI